MLLYLSLILFACAPARAATDPGYSADLQRAQKQWNNAKAEFLHVAAIAVSECGRLEAQRRLHPGSMTRDDFPPERETAHLRCQDALGPAVASMARVENLHRRLVFESMIWYGAGAISKRKGHTSDLVLDAFSHDLEVDKAAADLGAAVRVEKDENEACDRYGQAVEARRKVRRTAACVAAAVAVGLCVAFLSWRRRDAEAVPVLVAEPALPGATPHPRALDYPRVLAGGQYRVLREPVPDSLGLVFSVEDADTRAKYLVRRLREQVHRSARDLDAILSQARRLAELRHPNIVEVRWVFVEDEQVHLVSEAAGGSLLAERLREGPRLFLDKALNAALEVLYAVEHAHSKGLCHGNLTPSSVFITPGGRVKVQDFGIAFVAARTAAREGWQAGLMNSPYMAPEQELGRGLPASDVFSAGVILYELASGALPFPGPDFLAQKRAQAFVLPCARVPGLPEALGALLSRALEPEASRRCTAAELIAALEKGLA